MGARGSTNWLPRSTNSTGAGASSGVLALFLHHPIIAVVGVLRPRVRELEDASGIVQARNWCPVDEVCGGFDGVGAAQTSFDRQLDLVAGEQHGWSESGLSHQDGKLDGSA